MPKPLTVWITINCGKFWKRWEYLTTWPASWESYMQVRKQQLELDMEQQTGSNLGKGYIMAVYCHPANLTYMQNTPCEMPGWIFTISYWQLKKTWEMIMLVFVFMLVVEYMCMCLVVSDSATMDCSLSGSSVHGVLQAKILQLVAISFSRGSFWPRDGTHTFCDPCISRQILYHWTTWEAYYWWEHFINYTWSLI